MSNSRDIGHTALGLDLNDIMNLSSEKEDVVDAIHGVAKFAKEFLDLIDAADATGQVDIPREALKRLAAAGSVKGALPCHELRGLASRLANHVEMTRLSLAAMEDNETIEHFSHQHPLRRIPNVFEEAGWRNWCDGCERYFLPGEVAYGCNVNCNYGACLHEECAEMPREIRHPVHPLHQLKLEYLFYPILRADNRCVVCEGSTKSGLVYVCNEGCDGLWFHLMCSGDMQVAPDEHVISHPSHPQHELRFLRRKRGSCAFDCDACGTAKKGNSYICTICHYCIHESCASLPAITHLHHHAHARHSLSLAFHLPYEYSMYDYTCSICSGALRLTQWVYHCALCRYVIHIDCASKPSTTAISNISDNGNAVDDKDILRAPARDMYEEMIKPFVERQRGEISVPHLDNINTYEFHISNHPLSFTTFSSSSSSHIHNEEEEDDDDNCEGSTLKCDGCTLPINENSSNEGYMSCKECIYFLHLACFNLPTRLPSLPLHKIKGHELRLQSVPDKLKEWKCCSFCQYSTNGLLYSCTACYFKLDIKCASLPDTIKHFADPQNQHYLKLVTDIHKRSFCASCYEIIYREEKYYRCDNCIFSICYKCILLPAHTTHRLENHLLPLTYDASVNRPGDCCCSSCEEKMHSRSWKYHCRECDQSFHSHCCVATSGEYRNINFGRTQYHVSHHPHHLLRFLLIFKKKHCDLCHEYVYDCAGYQCESCNFAMCCRHHREAVQLID